MERGFTRHARRKMHALGLSVDEINAVVGANDVIERYETREGCCCTGWCVRASSTCRSSGSSTHPLPW